MRADIDKSQLEKIFREVDVQVGGELSDIDVVKLEDRIGRIYQCKAHSKSTPRLNEEIEEFKRLLEILKHFPSVKQKVIEEINQGLNQYEQRTSKFMI